MKKPVIVLPKTLGACADRLYQLRQDRLALQKQVDAIAEQESLLKEHIIATLPKSEASGISGKVANVAVMTKVVPQVTDWDQVYKHIKKTGQFELLGRSVTASAVKERWDNGKEVPGISHFTVVTVSLTKV